jgi:hypothetical protein
MRRTCWVRRQLDSKPNTYPESMDVDAAGISVKVNVHYPGRSAKLPMCYRRREVSGWDGRSQPRA